MTRIRRRESRRVNNDRRLLVVLIPPTSKFHTSETPASPTKIEPPRQGGKEARHGDVDVPGRAADSRPHTRSGSLRCGSPTTSLPAFDVVRLTGEIPREKEKSSCDG